MAAATVLYWRNALVKPFGYHHEFPHHQFALFKSSTVK